MNCYVRCQQSDASLLYSLCRIGLYTQADEFVLKYSISYSSSCTKFAGLKVIPNECNFPVINRLNVISTLSPVNFELCSTKAGFNASLRFVFYHLSVIILS